MDGRQSQAIVVGVDESDSARDAAEWAADLAALWGVPLHLVHVVPDAPHDAPITLQPTWLTELCAAAVRTGADPQNAEVVPGDPVDTLGARAGEARMLVLGSYGSGASSGMLAGSVAMRLLERVQCPVVVVRGSAAQIPPPRGGPVVVGVDGSASGRAGLEFAADLAAALGAPLVAVHTWTDIAVGRDGELHRIEKDESELAAEAADRLDAALAPVIAAHPRLVVAREVVQDTPLRALLAMAGRARLVVVGHRSHRPAGGMALGSTSQALVEFAPCPIAVIKPIEQRRQTSATSAPEVRIRRPEGANGMAVNDVREPATAVDAGVAENHRGVRIGRVLTSGEVVDHSGVHIGRSSGRGDVLNHAGVLIGRVRP